MGGTEKGASTGCSVRATKTVSKEREKRVGKRKRDSSDAKERGRKEGRKVVERARAKRREKGWSTLRVIRSRPSRAPLYPPRLYVPRRCSRRVRASVCAVVKTHTSKASTSLGAAGRRATPHGVGVASSTDSFLSLSVRRSQPTSPEDRGLLSLSSRCVSPRNNGTKLDEDNRRTEGEIEGQGNGECASERDGARRSEREGRREREQAQEQQGRELSLSRRE